MIPVTDGVLGCVACDAAGPAVAMGWQGLLCAALTGSVLLRVATQDLLGALFRQRRALFAASSEVAGEGTSSGRSRSSAGSRTHARGQSGMKRVLKTKVSGSFQTVLAIFSAVHLATGEFLRNAAPSLNISAVPSSVMVKLIVIAHIIPFLLLVGLDIFIARRFSPTASRRYRAGILAAALVLVLRQVELYLGVTRPMLRDLEAFSPLALALAICGAVAFICWLTYRAFNTIRTFFAYFTPAAIVLMFVMAQSQPIHNQYYEAYDLSEVVPRDPTGKPVFIIVFDEFAYEALLDESGYIDAALYPNFARLGDESLHLTNAQSNYFRTRLQVPDMIDATVPLTEDYELRIYEQTHRIEALYAPGCGSEYTCRGNRYLVEQNDNNMTAYLAMRTFYFAVPDWVEKAASAPIHFAVRQVGAPPPPADPTGMHEITTQLLDMYVADITRESATGRIFFLHTLLPHFPFVYDEYGNFEVEDLRDFDRNPNAPQDEEEFARAWDFYKEQIRYADTFLGELFTRLESEGLYDDSVIIVTADHGARPLFPVWDDPIEIGSITTNVPMFIRAPGVAPTRSDIDYQHVDFGATLFDVLGYEYTGASSSIDVSQGVALGDPVSALDPVRPDRERIFYVDVYLTGYWRYVYNEAAGTWDVVESVGSPIPDRTELLGGVNNGDEPLP